MRRWLLGLLLAGALVFPRIAAADAGADFPLPAGHFYSEANGRGGGPGQPGFAILDRDGVPFWTAFERGGGVAAFGYPISRPFPLDGFIDQAMQKAIFQWDGHAVAYLNVLDRLHQDGRDGWLQTRYLTPPPLDTAPDTGLPWPQVVARHQQLLDANPALRAAYFGVPDPLARYGLPLTPPTPEAGGAVVVVRCQRAVLQQWLTAQPWAAAGQVTVANAGDIAKAADLIPGPALVPQPSTLVGAGGNTPSLPLRARNWAGYVVLDSLAPGAVTDVAGSWVVPAVDCTATPTAHMGVWLGIDGLESDTMQEVGTEANCESGRASYLAWWEIYPSPSTAAMPVRPGDVITADVAYLGGGTYQFILTDTTTGQGFSLRRPSSDQRISAEWGVILPAFSAPGQPLTALPKFTPVTFTKASVVINGVRGAIANSAWRASPLTLVGPDGRPQAVPSPLTADGTGFQVTWQGG